MQGHDDELVRLGRLRAEEADLFRLLTSSAIRIAWARVDSPDPALRRYARPMGPGEPTVILAQRAEGDVWTAGLLWADGRKEALMALQPLAACQGVAEDYVRSGKAVVLSIADAPWRQKAPSPKQRAYARRLGVEYVKGQTAGELSDLIAAAQLREGWTSQ
jgi:hypothetical protein